MTVAAVETPCQWRFKKVFRAGRPVEALMTVTGSFILPQDRWRAITTRQRCVSFTFPPIQQEHGRR